MSIETIIAAHPKNYFCRDEIVASEVVDPLAKVVPSLAVEFFGPYVCNIIIFTKLLLNGSNTWDEPQHAETKALLIASFEKFARYELHFYIDSAADGVATASSSDRTLFKNKLIALAAELSDYNVYYHGEKQDTQLDSHITEVIAAFNTVIGS
jgi:hypothetical protein